MAMLVTDHRAVGAVLGNGDGKGGADFGFGRALAYRLAFAASVVGIVGVYPARVDGEGFEFTVAVEGAVVEELLRDEEFGRWFEFRGVEWEEEGEEIGREEPPN
jgi:hypothetical protein